MWVADCFETVAEYTSPSTTIYQLTSANLMYDLATYMLYGPSMSSVSKQESCLDVLSGLGAEIRYRALLEGTPDHGPYTTFNGDSRRDLRGEGGGSPRQHRMGFSRC